VNGFDYFFFQGAATHVRLIRRDHQTKARLLQQSARLFDARQNLKFRQISGRIGLSISQQNAVDHSIPVQENGGRRRAIIWWRGRHA